MSNDRAGLVVIGSGPAGTEAALSYRNADGEGRVHLITGDPAEPYERPPLSKDFLQGDTEEAELGLHPSQHYADNGIEFTLGDPVVALDPGGRFVTTLSGTRVGFQTCVIAVGASPSLPPVNGISLPGVFVLRSLQNARSLQSAADTCRRAVVVGSGFIGCEAAVSLARRGVDVTLISSEPRPQDRRLGSWVGERIAEWLKAERVELIAGRTLEGITRTESGALMVQTDTGATFATEMVLLAAGVKPNGSFAADAGLNLEGGRIRVDSGMRTSASGIFAAGDVALAEHDRAGRPLSVEHWTDALVMGGIAGANAAGRSSTWIDVPGFWSTIGDHTLKYSAWGDGYDREQVVEHSDGSFTVWYAQAGRTVGVLTHRADQDYEAGTYRVQQGLPLPD